MARLPPPCHPLYCRLRLFDRRTRRHSPLRTRFLRAALGICHSRGLPTQGRRRSDPNGTSPTRSQQSEGASSSRSPGPFRDALAAIRPSVRRQEFPITDAVRLSVSRNSFSTAGPRGSVASRRLRQSRPPKIGARDATVSSSSLYEKRLTNSYMKLIRTSHFGRIKRCLILSKG